MGKCKSKLVISTAFMIVSLFSSIGISFAWWFTNNTIVSNVTGNTPPSYFAFGDGSEESPYGITSPVHLYNLAWLQYLGTFNNPTDQKQYHFVLDKDIDMKGLTLPPIGTTDNPFIGTFDGGNHLISNLTVSNKLGEDDISKYPSGITSLTGVDIVGMFGVVGNYNDVINYQYDTSKIDISNLYLDNVKITSSNPNSLMGLIFGYIEEGNAKNIDVGRGNIEAASNVKPLSNYNSISKYSLIGDFNETNISWTDKPQDATPPDGDGGWGESLNIYTLARRLNYMFTEGDNITQKIAYVSSSDVFNTEIYNDNQDSSLSYKKSNIQFYLSDNSYLPLNIDEATMIDNATESSKTVSTNSGSLTSLTNSFYSQKKPEIVSSTNTGYLVGGGTPNLSTTWPSLKGTSFKTHIVDHSYLNYSYGSATPSDKTNVDLLTMVESDDKSGNYQLQIISDQYNQGKTNNQLNHTRVPVENFNFNNYDDVREKLNTLLLQDNIYGMSFYRPSTSSSFALDINNTTNANVSILGKNYTNYPLLKTSIMFNVSSGGYLTFIAAGMDNNQVMNNINYSLYNLYKISRNSSTNQIEAITKIENIYKTAEGQYLYNQSSRPANSTLVFNSVWIAKIVMQTSLIYMEIPLFADMYPAEFALGGSIEPTSYPYPRSAYLMYLDLGASGEEGVIPPTTPTTEYTLDSIQFVDKIPSDRSNHATLLYVAFKLSKDQTTTLVNIYFKRDSNELMFYYVDPSSGATITALVATGVSVQSSNTITF